MKLQWAVLFVVSGMASFCAGQISAQCSEIHIHASVLNDQKQVVAGLTGNNFSAQINGKSARIGAFEFRPPRHRVIVLIDHSGSMEWMRWGVAQEAVPRFVGLIPVNVPVGIIFFDDKLHELVPLTTDRDRVTKSLQDFFSSTTEAPKGRTSLFDAIDSALSSLVPPQPGDLIYVVTDAGDNQSKVDPGELQKRLVNSGTRLFALLLGRATNMVLNSEELDGDTRTENMIRRTGGAFARVPVPEPDPEHERKVAHLTQQSVDRMSMISNWLVQNMIDSYDLTLVPSQAHSGNGKLKLQVQVPNTNGKFRVIAPTTVAVNCP